MRRLRFVLCGIAIAGAIGAAPGAQTAGPYTVVKTVKVGGVGGFDYINADVAGRRLYVARSGAVTPRILVFNLDTLEQVGEISSVNAHGALVDPKSHHGFASSKPITMFDARTLAIVKTIDVPSNPDGMMFDAFNGRLYVLSRTPPYTTVINAADGSVVGTIDLAGPAEQSVPDGKGHVYMDIDIMDKGEIAVVDAKTLAVTAHYALPSHPDGLAMDVKNRILFSTCRIPLEAMVILNADSGTVITTLPIGSNNDGAGFNPATMEAFGSQGEQSGDGTLTIVKENSPTSFVVEQTVRTIPNAKTMTVDTKTNRVLLFGAQYGPPMPPPPGGGRGGGRPMLPDSFAIVVVGK